MDLGVGDDVITRQSERCFGCVDASACDAAGLVFQPLDGKLFFRQFRVEYLAKDSPMCDFFVVFVVPVEDSPDLCSDFLEDVMRKGSDVGMD